MYSGALLLAVVVGLPCLMGYALRRWEEQAEHRRRVLKEQRGRYLRVCGKHASILSLRQMAVVDTKTCVFCVDRRK